MTGRPQSMKEAGRSLPLKATAFVAAVCLLLAIMGGWREWTSRDREAASAEVETFNLAQSLAQHADDTFSLADTALIGLIERVETAGTSPAALAQLNHLLRTVAAEVPRIQGLFIYDEDGNWIASSLDHLPSDLNNADREYFRFHRDSPDRGPHLGKPIRSRSSGDWVVTVTRRLQHTDGRFAGVALATLNVSYFSEFFRRFNVG
jgi:hypothetical protein